MASSRAFAYNSGSALSGVGLTQVGRIASSTGILSGSIDWVAGPDEDIGYVIAGESSGHSTPGGGLSKVQFWRSPSKTDESFLALSNYMAIRYSTPQNFTVATQAVAWLNSNGYWTSYPSTTEVIFSQTFTSGQSPTTAIENAWTTFRSQLTGTYTKMDLSNNIGHSIVVTDSRVQDIANALRLATTGTNTTVVIGSNTWRVAHGCVSGTVTANSIYLTTGTTCVCTGTYTVRPMIKNANWGGLNGSSCNQQTQTITLKFS